MSCFPKPARPTKIREWSQTTHPGPELQAGLLPNRKWRFSTDGLGPRLRGDARFLASLRSGKKSARMGLFIGFHQRAHVHRGVGLGGGERGMAQQFLHAAKIAAALEQMGGKGMSKRMGRGFFGQAQP